ncbi:MAG: hypothetical protein AAGJ18_06530, partial [Bacteroidota bacterium]
GKRSHLQSAFQKSCEIVECWVPCQAEYYKNEKDCGRAVGTLMLNATKLNRPATTRKQKGKKDKKAFQGFLVSKNITQEPLVMERNF